MISKHRLCATWWVFRFVMLLLCCSAAERPNSCALLQLSSLLIKPKPLPGFWFRTWWSSAESALLGMILHSVFISLTLHYTKATPTLLWRVVFWCLKTLRKWQQQRRFIKLIHNFRTRPTAGLQCIYIDTGVHILMYSYVLHDNRFLVVNCSTFILWCSIFHCKSLKSSFSKCEQWYLVKSK